MVSWLSLSSQQPANHLHSLSRLLLFLFFIILIFIFSAMLLNILNIQLCLSKINIALDKDIRYNRLSRSL